MIPNHCPHPNWMRSGAVALAALILVGCSPGVAGPPPSAQLESPPANTATPLPEIAPTEVVPIPSATPTEAASAATEPAPIVRKGLHATDPGGVVLASGRPQLVEFFAFW